MKFRLNALPLLPLCLGVVAGVIFATNLPSFLWLAAVASAGLTLSILLKQNVVAMGVVGLCIGWIAADVAKPPAIESLPPRLTPIEGTVKDIRLTNGGLQLTMIADGDFDGCRITITTDYVVNSPEPGQRISIKGDYNYPERIYDFTWPGMPVDQSRRNGIAFHAFVRGDSLAIIDSRPATFTQKVNNYFYHCRERLKDLIINSDLDESSAGFITTLLTGDNSMIEADERQAFSSTGVAHILSISGAHVAALAWLISILLSPLTLARRRRWRFGITIVMLWWFAMLTGMSASVVRSVIMASILLVGLILERNSNPLNSLCLACIIILTGDPMALYSPGFQLSFIATAAIVIFVTETAESRFMAKGRLHRLKQVVGVTLIATIATAPLVAYHFHNMPLLFLISNLLIAPMLPVFMACGLLIVLCNAAGCPHWLLAEGINRLYHFLTMAIDWIAGFEWGRLRGIYFQWEWLLPCYVLLIAATVILLHGKKALVARVALVALIAAISAAILTTPAPYPSEEITFERKAAFTSLVMKRGDTLEVLNNHSNLTLRYDSLDYANRLIHYIDSRKIKVLKFSNRFEDFADSAGVINIAGRKYLWADSPNPEFDSARANYLIVTRNYRIDIVDLAQIAPVDTIILSTDIPKIRRERYFRELREAAMPAIDASAELFHRTQQ
ncbi:MAG: ComEC/Rec2 family competence protein [Muribaculaceae bacterium]|nr:ComEC/Rec2 family competence protein [Muribaculaceae bacterium]